MNIIKLEKKNYELIYGTQSDGRCFSASVYYDLNLKIPDSSVLNQWIKQYIIDPILNTENTNCPQFFLWATIWAGMHNGYLLRPDFFSTIKKQNNFRLAGTSTINSKP